MALIRALFGAAQPNPAADFWYAPLGTVSRLGSGALVSPDTALKVSAVWACVRLLAESVAGLPLLLYERLPDGGKARAVGHPLYAVLHRRPNAWQTPFEFLSQQMVALLLRGNAYARIVPGPTGAVDQLWPLSPDAVTPELTSAGEKRYVLKRPGRADEVLLADEVLHVPGLSVDGVCGMSVITYARESIGLAMATEAYGARFFGNDSRPGGVLQHPGKLSDAGRDNLKASWEAAHRGTDHAHRVAVLEEGLEWKPIGIAPEDAQFLATREFQVADICRWFNVPLHMVQETSKVTSWGSGIEQLSTAFVTYSLLAWLRRWEQAVNRDLVLDADTYFAEFLLDALLRGELEPRYRAYALALQNKIMTPNEVRIRENMNPVPGGDEFLEAPTPAGGAGGNGQAV
jgi:HK97 family phage portal protein